MHADYIANPLYDNNPFIEALPPMLSGKDLIRALAVIPPYSDSDRDRSTGERLQLLSSLYEFYQPLSMTVDLYCEIHTAMQHCYGQYSVQSEAATFQNGYSLMHGNALAASIGGGNSFSVVGVSGLGKSTALQRVLSLYPQVIEHTEYHGQKFYCHQIPYLVVQTPHDASIKALILDIYLQIDSLIGTTYQKDALSRRLSIDVLVSQLNQIVRVNHIGLLVIDELQNIAYRKSDGGIRNILATHPTAHIIREVYTGTTYQGRRELDKLLHTVQAGDTIVFDSVSRMSRNADEGCQLYEDLYAQNVTLCFLKEPHINTETYRQTIQRQISTQLKTGNAATDSFVSSVIAALNQYTVDLAKEQIRLAFAQAQKEVDDLHQRTREGMLTAKLNGKQIGQERGRKLVVKKAAACKDAIKKYSKDFDGTLSDADCIKLIGIARNTYYKYKGELRSTL